MTLYATLDDVKNEMLADSTLHDAEIMRGLRQVSRRVDGIFKRPNLFAPVIEARDIALSASGINSADRTLMLRPNQGGLSPLLSLTGTTLNGSALVVGTTVQAYPVATAPYYQLQLLGDCWSSWYASYCSGRSPNALVTGIWGYHPDYAHAWTAVDELGADLTDSAVVLTVTDVDGETSYGETPRISPGHLLRIDDEWMDVIATVEATNIVAVVRGVNGTTAAAHESGAVVSVWQVDDDVRRAVTRQVAFQYARKGAYETRKVQEFTAIDYVPDLLQEFRNLLNQFANL